MLDLYYHLHDEDSQQAMRELAGTALRPTGTGSVPSPPEGNLRANGESKIEKLLQVPEFQELTECLSDVTERGGFSAAHLAPLSRVAQVT